VPDPDPDGVFAGVPDAFGRLWTPHRLAYIQGAGKPTGPGAHEGCPFCVAPTLTDEEALIVARGELVYAILNLYPYNSGHVLVCPYRHVADYAELSVAESVEFGDFTIRAIRALRDYTRARTRLVQVRTRCWQRLEKLLESALVKVSSVASKLTTESAKDMVKAMIAGQRDPRTLAALARGRMKAKHDDLVEALDGMFDDHHGELAQMLLDQIAFCDTRIGQLTARITGSVAAMPEAWGVDGDGTTGPDAGTGPDAAVAGVPGRPGRLDAGRRAGHLGHTAAGPAADP